MNTRCKGICQRLKSAKFINPNRFTPYTLYKFCSKCGYLVPVIKYTEIRCICCNYPYRTNPRAKISRIVPVIEV